MKAQLTIHERLDEASTFSTRTRLVALEGDSITIGSNTKADIVLKNLGGSVLVEIKYASRSWWLMNLDRSDHVKLQNKIVPLETKIHHNDEIDLYGHKIIFEIAEKTAEDSAPKFSFKAHNDTQLWNYLLEEPEFDEVMINGAKEIYVDYGGQLFKSPYQFQNNTFLTSKITELTKQDSGWGSTRLNRALRIQTALPPIVEVPHLSIRKARKLAIKLSTLLSTGFGTLEEMDFLRKAIQTRQNILIAGGTSTGKTVLLRSLIELMDPNDRVVVVEEEAETDWPHPHAVAIESGRGQLRNAVIECLRMRPTRLIVSEVRGAEAFEMLQAMNTGHAGSMTTMHANSPREALHRLEALVLSAGVGTNLLAVRKQIAFAIHAIVQLKREPSGRRKIDQIVRIGGIQNDTILLSDPIQTETTKLKQKIFKIDS